MECMFCEAVLLTKREKLEEICHVCASSEEEARKQKDADRRSQKGKRDRIEDEEDED